VRSACQHVSASLQLRELHQRGAVVRSWRSAGGGRSPTAPARAPPATQRPRPRARATRSSSSSWSARARAGARRSCRASAWSNARSRACASATAPRCRTPGRCAPAPAGRPRPPSRPAPAPFSRCLVNGATAWSTRSLPQTTSPGHRSCLRMRARRLARVVPTSACVQPCSAQPRRLALLERAPGGPRLAALRAPPAAHRRAVDHRRSPRRAAPPRRPAARCRSARRLAAALSTRCPPRPWPQAPSSQGPLREAQWRSALLPGRRLRWACSERSRSLPGLRSIGRHTSAGCALAPWPCR